MPVLQPVMSQVPLDASTGRAPYRGRFVSRPFDREVLLAGSVAAAPHLVGALLVAGERIGRIVEVEAYGGADDPASHAWKGPTRRNATMFAPAGRLYVYFTYGMHWCANVVTGSQGDGQAVLVRALEPVAGLQAMRTARPGVSRDRDLCRGPGRLCRALGIDGSHDGLDLLNPAAPVRLVVDDDGGTSDEPAPVATTRIGISRAAEVPWRWCRPGSPYLSRPVSR
jgi:DNA-3-methyladenine glycosylase